MDYLRKRWTPTKADRCALRMLLGVAIFGLLAAGPSIAVETVKVGVVLPLSGFHAEQGQMEKRSLNMAVEEINLLGGVKGRKLELIFEDVNTSPELGPSAIKKLMEEHEVVMLSGGCFGPVALALASAAQQNRLPFLVNTGSTDSITEQGWDYVFRLDPPVSEYVSAVESYLAQVVKPRTAVILREQSEFGARGGESFMDSCDKLGIEILAVEGYKPGSNNFKPTLYKMKKLNPDVVYMVSHLPEASALMREARQVKLTPGLFIGGAPCFALPEFAQQAGKASEKVVCATPWHQSLPLPGAREYFSKFKARHRTAAHYLGAEAYAAAHVISDALNRTSSFKAYDIRQALKETDLMTVFGPVKFVAYGNKANQNRLTTYLVQWVGGKTELIWPEELATSNHVFPVDWLAEWGYSR